MAYENLCMYCFKDLGGEVICPHCGGDSRAAVPQVQLLPGTLVYNQRFLVGRALGQDSNGIVYNALDTRRGGVIRIREYLPRNCAERLNDGKVVPIAGMEDAFDTGMRKLHASVESVEDPRQRHFYFEENGTAYIAQRKNTAPAPDPYAQDEDEEEDRRRKHTIICIAVVAAVVLVIAIIAIVLFSRKDATDDQTTTLPLSSPSASASSEAALLPWASPSASPGSSALVDPELNWLEFTKPSATASQPNVTPTGTDMPGDTQDYPTVSGASNKASVRKLQNRLAQLGWLSPDNVNGIYDETTRESVRAFQQYINDAFSPAEKLSEDGIAGNRTQQWLYDANVPLTRPTPTPTPRVTAAPDDGTIDAHSSAEAIRALQNQLISLGLLPQGSADGRYGNATESAVRSFQRRVNELQGYTLLNETGRADALTRAWLNYYVEEWEKYVQQQQKITPTPTRAGVTATPNLNVDASSSRESIREVQQLLAQVGLLDATDIDGTYGRQTQEAVVAFQQWVNTQRGSQTLEVSGVVDPLTRRYLDYCVENGISCAPTTASTTDTVTTPPTFEPEPEVTEVPPEQQAGSDGITPESPRESIEFMQEMLRDIGLLSDDQISGIYDDNSRAAISAFQSEVNNIYGESVLSVTGNCDPETLKYLQDAYDEGWNLGDSGDVPDIESVNPQSPPEDIEYMQEMLRGIGLMSDDQISGTYDDNSRTAISAFQSAVNSIYGALILPVTGDCNPETLRYLQEAYTEGWNLADSGDVPDIESVNPQSPPEDIKYMQTMLQSIGLLGNDQMSGSYDDNSRAAISAFQSAVNSMYGTLILSVTGDCDPETFRYLQEAYTEGWNLSDSGDVPDDEFFGEPSVEPGDVQTPEPTQTPTVPDGGIGPGSPAEDIRSLQRMLAQTKLLYEGQVSGNYDVSTEQAVRKVQMAVNNFNDDDILEITGICDADTLGYLQYAAQNGMDLSEWAEQDEPTAGPSDTPTEAPTESPLPELTDSPTPEPTDAPTPGQAEPLQVSTISSLLFFLSGEEVNGTVKLEPGKYEFGWQATGDVESYDVYLYDGNKAMMKSAEATAMTSFKLDTDIMNPGEVYELRVGAMPVNGTKDDIIWHSLQLTLSVVTTPEPTDAPTPAPSVSAPVITIASTTHDVDGVPYVTDEKITFQWMAEGRPENYTVNLYNENDERYSLKEDTSETSITITGDQLEPGIYRLHVGARPVGGGNDAIVWSEKRFGIPTAEATAMPENGVESQPTDSPDTEQHISFVDADSSAVDIQAVQMALYSHGLLNVENVTSGKLDDATLEAVASFQQHVNAQYGASLEVIDPDIDPYIDSETLELLLYQNLDLDV